MKAYRLSVNLKLGLILVAVALAVASLAYTNHLVNRLRTQEQASVRIWADANKQLVSPSSFNPYHEVLQEMEQWLFENPDNTALPLQKRQDFLKAIAWAKGMPPSDYLTFISDIALFYIDVPAVITDSLGTPQTWHHLPIPDTVSISREDTLKVLEWVKRMADAYPPIPVELEFPAGRLKQYVYYDESDLIKELRIYPYVQLLFVGLFILVGYLGFSYVRRSEQSNLWVGMAREAAHQLGTPISSLMGWLELIRKVVLQPSQQVEAYDEIGKDIERLERVANRFSDIGSLPKLDQLPIAPLIHQTADYMRRRFPQSGKHVTLQVDVDDDLKAPVNAELFEWVIENLLKNALDAIESEQGQISVEARQFNESLVIDIRDTGKGIDRRQWKNVFRPGYSTKKRGWGLGLSLAKRIVEDYHGGTLTLLQSKLGQGTTFRISLPVRPQKDHSTGFLS